MSHINHPIKTALVVGPSLAAIAPGRTAATPYGPVGGATGPHPLRWRSCTSQPKMASTGATLGSLPRAASASRCWGPAVASSSCARAVITSTPQQARRQL
jgi:hypothetical protein